MTGKYSIYTLYEGHEIMFHVSTLLPFSRDNRQQVRTHYNINVFCFPLSFSVHSGYTSQLLFGSLSPFLAFLSAFRIQTQQLRIICQMNSTNNLYNIRYCLKHFRMHLSGKQTIIISLSDLHLTLISMQNTP